nr:transporter [Kutzneria sp. 744]
MWIVDCCRLLLLGGLALAVAAGHADIALLLVVGLLLGVGQTLFDTSSQATVPLLVPPDGQKLEKANGRLSLGQTTGEQLVGPSVGGFLFGIAAAVPLAVDAVSFAVSAVVLRGLARRRGPTAPPRQPGRSIRRDIAEGLGWLRRQPTVLALAATVGVTNLGYMASSTMLVLYAKRELGLSSGEYGLLLSAIAAGAVLGALVSARVARFLGSGGTLSAALGLLVVSRVGLGFTSHVAVAVPCLMAAGLGLTMFGVVSISLLQRLVPDRLRGRVMSAYRLIALTPEPIGGVLGGVLADRAGLHAPFLLGGALVALVALATLPTLSNRALRRAAERSEAAVSEGNRD